MSLPGLQKMCGLLLAAFLCVPAWASKTDTTSTPPGTLNYVEGQAQFNDTSLNPTSIGQSTLQDGQTLRTESGKAELVLTPGVYLRAGDNTSVKMMDSSLTDTSLKLLAGHAIVEVTDIYKQNDIRVQEGTATSHLVKNGLYEFDLRENQIRVFQGEAIVHDGDQRVKLKAGHDMSLAGNGLSRSQKFDKQAFEQSDLYKWSNLRSTYLAEANIGSPQWAEANGSYGLGPWGYGPGWWGPGWDWGWGWGPWGGWWGPWW
jgi:hypothetical protein